VGEGGHPAIERLRAAFPEDAADPGRWRPGEFRGQRWLELPRERVFEALRILRDEPGLEYRLLSDVTCTDHPEEEFRFRVIWNLTSFTRRDRFRLRTRVPEDDPTAPSATPLFATADWLEREAYDMFGVLFDGHPNLRRIMMPESYHAFPLRKEFPMEGDRSDREWAAWVIARAGRAEGEPL